MIPVKTLSKYLLLPLLVLVLANCSTLRFPGVYRIDVAQGNIVTQDLLDKLEVGMNANQVKYVLGAPMIEDTFNTNRWDYYYSYKHGYTGETDSSLVSVFFNDSGYERYELKGKIKASSIRSEAIEKPEERKRFLWLF